MRKNTAMVRFIVAAGLGVALISGYTANAEASWFCSEPYHEHSYERRHHHSRHYSRGSRGFVIVIGDGRPYNCGGGYPRNAEGGYRVVATPQAFVVNVPNRNGSYTQVTLQVASNGTYVGPQGEVYPTQPTMEQLQAMYGQ